MRNYVFYSNNKNIFILLQIPVQQECLFQPQFFRLSCNTDYYFENNRNKSFLLQRNKSF